MNSFAIPNFPDTPRVRIIWGNPLPQREAMEVAVLVEAALRSFRRTAREWPRCEVHDCSCEAYLRVETRLDGGGVSVALRCDGDGCRHAMWEVSPACDLGDVRYVSVTQIRAWAKGEK